MNKVLACLLKRIGNTIPEDGVEVVVVVVVVLKELHITAQLTPVILIFLCYGYGSILSMGDEVVVCNKSSKILVRAVLL